MGHIATNPPLDESLVDALVQIWTDVSNAGGSVGFVPPVDVDDVRPLAEAAFARVRDGKDDLVVAFEGAAPVAFGFLALNEFHLHQHWATVKRLQRHPAQTGGGTGGKVLEALEQTARDRGIHLLTLTVRGGTGREAYYQAKGYHLDAVLPGRLRLQEGVHVDELHLSKPLTEGARERSGPPLLVQRLDPDLPMPARAHPGDAGLDLYAREPVVLGPRQRAMVPTGVAIALAPGHVGLVHPRSGLAARHGVGLLNAPGTIDEGYRGEVQVILVNHDATEPVTIQRGDRIAQLVVQRVETVRVVEVDTLPDSARSDGGFGSTGR